MYAEPVIAPLGERPAPMTRSSVSWPGRLDVDDDLLKQGSEACVRYMLRDTPVDIDFLKAHSQFPQKLEGVKVIPVGEHGFKTPTGKFELYSTVIEKFPGLDPLPTYRDSIDDTDPEKYPFRLVSGARLPTALHSRLHKVPWLRSMRPVPTADLNDEDATKAGDGEGRHHRTLHPGRYRSPWAATPPGPSSRAPCSCTTVIPKPTSTLSSRPDITIPIPVFPAIAAPAAA